jgi:hypothetical protein
MSNSKQNVVKNGAKNAGKGYLFFWSRGSAKVKCFSNFWGVDLSVTWASEEEEGIPGFLRGETRRYPSAEHAYMALRALDNSSACEFEVGGLFASFEIFRKWPKKGGGKDMMASKQKAWGECIGIIAKMVSRLEPGVIWRTWGVKWESKKRLINVWRDIFEAKYTAENGLGKALLATMPLELVEFDRAPHHKKMRSFWGGKLVEGRLVGANTMGGLLQERRVALA